MLYSRNGHRSEVLICEEDDIEEERMRLEHNLLVGVAMERTLVNKKREADDRRSGEEEHHSGMEVVRGQVHKCDAIAVGKEGQYEEMSEEELGVWCGRYKNMDAMEGYMLIERKEPQTQARFVPSLAKAALLKDLPVALSAEFGSLYRWIWRFDQVMGGRTPGKEDRAFNVSFFVRREVDEELKRYSKSVLIRGWRWVMQLRSADGKWVDWIQIQKSNRPGPQLSVFSARDFPKGSTIGFCCGELKGMASEGKGDSKAVKRLEDVEEGWTYRNSKGKWQTVVAKKVDLEEEGGQPLYLGMHYVNSACYGYEVGSREYQKAKKSYNCSLLEDGSVIASKKICPNVELLLS
jgi:hypothetical protein